MKEYDVCGMGNGLLDILVEISESEFQALGMEKASMRLVEIQEQRDLIQRFRGHPARKVSGGSVANSVIALSQLGGKGAFVCSLGDDEHGRHYRDEFKELGIRLSNPLVPGEHTGTCLVLITPDAERTMRTCLGFSAHLAEANVSEEIIRSSKWLFIEGYLFSNPERGHGAIRKALQLAKKHGTKVAITFSEAWVIHAFGDMLREAVGQAELVFANEAESIAFTGESDYRKAFAALKAKVPNAVVTAGPQGALVRFDGKDAEVGAFPCEPKDLTGAGDMFAASILYGMTHGFEPAKAGRAACYLSSKVITQVGARLSSGTREYWNQAIG